MKLNHSDLKQGTMKVTPENLDDLWCLSQVIDIGDSIQGKTMRKIKIGEASDRKQEVVKKPVFLEIKAEKIEYSKDANSLRVSGTVEQGPEDIPLGSYHTITIEENTTISIRKEEWLNYQIDKIKEASLDKPTKILICVHDREEAYFALMKKYGYHLLSSFKGTVAKKADVDKVEGTFYRDVIKQLHDYDNKYQLNHIVLASPAFWKEDLLKELKDSVLRKKIVLATCSSVGENAIHEVLKRPETEEVLKQERAAKEFKLVEELLTEIAKNNNASYGLAETKMAAENGAVKTLLVADSFIEKKRSENSFKELENVMRQVDRTKGVVAIITTEHEAGKKLHGLGGIGAILRFRIK